jgi:hypothetical protein
MTTKPRSRVRVTSGVLDDATRRELEARFPQKRAKRGKPRRAWVNGYLSAEDRARIEKQFNCIILDGPPPPRKGKV